MVLAQWSSLHSSSIVFVLQVSTLLLVLTTQAPQVTAVNTVSDFTVDNTWTTGGFTLSFKINFVDGDSDGWTVVMGLKYKVVRMSVSFLILININFDITSWINNGTICYVATIHAISSKLILHDLCSV